MPCPSHSLDLIILITFGEDVSYEAPDYALFSNLQSLHLSYVQIFSSALCIYLHAEIVVIKLIDECRFCAAGKLLLVVLQENTLTKVSVLFKVLLSHSTSSFYVRYEDSVLTHNADITNDSKLKSAKVKWLIVA
jgi:hypothetical protein